jgi:DNA-binding MarR family transcriptional regulator
MTDFYTVETFAPRVSLGYLLRRVNKLSIAQVETAFDGSDISFTQWVVLALISQDVANTCTDLSRNMDHDKGALTRVVDQLVERGLIERRRDDDDRRVSNLFVTDAGYAVVADLAGRVVDVWNDLLADFSRDEAAALIASLTKLLVRLEAPQED